jgi:polar amino acid transport system substrate-binding protein
MTRLISIAFAFFLACGVSAGAGEVVALDSANPPFMFARGDKAAGVYPALIAEAFKRMNVDVTFAPMPWKRAIEGLDSGANAVGGIYKNSERLKKYDYSDKLFDEVIVVYVAKGKGFAFSGTDSLKGKTVGVIRGWSYGDDFDNAVKAKTITVDEAPDDGVNFGKLGAGRTDAVLAVKEGGGVAIASANLADKVEALDPPLSSSPSFLAFAKSANKTDLIAKFNAAIAAMRQDGSFDKIVAASLAAK